MDADFNNSLPHPERLKILASKVKYSKGNTILHQFVLDNSDPNQSGSKNYINAVLLSMAETAVNAVNDEQYTALQLAVLKNNILMVEKLLSCLPNIDVNKRCGKQEKNIALHIAVNLGHLTIIQELLNNGADVNIRNEQGQTALCFAVISCDLNMIKLLVSKGAIVNVTFRRMSPLHYAAQSGNLEIIKYLLSHGANFYSIGKNNMSILHTAAQSGHLATVEFLVNQGFHINAEDRWGNTPITYAAISGHVAIVEFLAYKSPNLKVNNGWRRLLSVAAQSGHLNVIKFFLDRIESVDINAILLDAAMSGNVETLEYLIAIGADVNTKSKITNDTPLHRAIKESGNLDAVEFLVKNGADLNRNDPEGKSILHHVVWGRKNLQIAEFLLEQGADLEAIDREGKTPLHDAAYINNSEYAEWLISKGANLNARDNAGKTPLHAAVYKNRLECAELLINKGADLCARDKNGITLLHVAVCGKNLECAWLLIKKGADLHAVNKCGKTALHEAVIFGSVECIKMLVEGGADVNARDTWNGFTPLHHLLHRFNTGSYDPECTTKIHLLLNLNADVNIKDEKGETPVYLAMQSVSHLEGFHFIVGFLTKAAEMENARNRCNIRTSLHYAIEYHNADIVRWLLARGVDPHATINNENSMLHYACSHPNHLDIIETLIVNGIDVNAQNVFGETPLHIVSNHIRCTLLLLQSGASVNIADVNGWTPLHTAAHKGHADVVKALLKRGADRNVKNKNRKTPLDLAKDNKHLLCVDALQQTRRF